MNRSLYFISLTLSLNLLLTACSGIQRNISNSNNSSTLGELPAAFIPPKQKVDDSSLDIVAAGYKDALALISDQVMQEDILRRLAMIELRYAEGRQVKEATTTTEDIYRDAIATYQVLLKTQQYRDDNDKLLYPLAKAYELSGDMSAALKTFNRLVEEFPESTYYSEAQFRRGEILFANADYSAASRAYYAIVQRNLRDEALPEHEPSSFLVNAYYMWGWSDFKLGRHQQALRAFVVVLDEYTAKASAGYASRSSDELVQDTYRVMALSFSYTQGADSIVELLDEVDEKPYSDQLFAKLGELYLDKKRYRDSASVFASYVQRYPQSPRAPEFQQRQIDAFSAGHFPNEVREQKKVFAASYAIDGEYWNSANPDTQVFIKDKLIVYLDELASYYHNQAQTAKQAWQKEGALASEQTAVQQQFRDAAVWYREWIRSFPEASDLAEKYFLLGETYFEASDFADAVAAYESAAYGYAGFARANEAGYAALISYDKLIALAPERVEDQVQIEAMGDEAVAPKVPDKQDWQIKKIESALLFAENFVDDARRNTVLAQTVTALLALEQHQRTIDVAALLIASENVASDLLFTAHVSSAHAHRAMAAYSDAEQSYRQALLVLGDNPNDALYQQHYQATLDNYAASIYKQGELANSNGDTLLAANTFLRVVELAPTSSIRVTAQHDASVLLMQAEQWQTAIAVISDFQQRFPGHVETAAAPARLLKANQELGDWSNAAIQALIIADRDPDDETRRQALYSAAEFFEKAKDNARAIDSYRRYAHDYEEPLAERMEAQFKLVNLYQAAGAVDKRKFWLRKLIATHADAKKQTDRSTYLAAFASADLAVEKLDAYYAVKLKSPLKKTLAKKRKAMTQAINAYEKTAAYGVAEYTTLATQRMGEIYASLATELMDSERPKNLSELELEQYNFLLEEQAYPFEEQAIEFFTVNIERAWQGSRTEGVKDSFKALAKLLPARFDKAEMRPAR